MKNYITLITLISLISACNKKEAASALPAAAPEIVNFLSMGSPAPLSSGNSSLWNFWIRNDGVNLPESTGTECDAATSPTALDYCVNAGLLRKVLLTQVNNCSSIKKMQDSLGAFVWSCAKKTSGSGVWIYTSEFAKDKGVANLIDSSGPSWKPVTVMAETSDTRYTSSETVLWTQDIVALPDSSSARAPLNEQNKVYYFNSDVTGFGFEIAASRVVLVGGADGTYKYAAAAYEADPDLDKGMIFGDDKHSLYLEGQFDADNFTLSGITLARPDLSTAELHSYYLNKLNIKNAVGAGLNVVGNTVDINNVRVSSTNLYNNNKPYTGNYLKGAKFSNNIWHDNANGGYNYSLTDGTITGFKLYNNASGFGAEFQKSVNIVASEIEAYDNYSGFSFGVDGSNIKISRVKTYRNAHVGIHLGQSTDGLVVSDIESFENQEIGVLSHNNNNNVKLSNISSLRDNVGLQVQFNTNFEISNLKVKDSVSTGVYLSNPAGPGLIKNILVENSGASGILTDTGNDITAQDVKVSGAGAVGIYFRYGSNRAVLKNVVVDSAVEAGVSFYSVYESLIDGVTVTNSGSGVEVHSGSTNSTMKNIKVNSVDTVGVSMHYSSTGSMENITVNDAGGDAVGIHSGSGLVPVKNITITNSGAGLKVYNSMQATIENVSVTNVTGSGIQLNSSGGGSIVNATIKGAGGDGLLCHSGCTLSAATNITISDVGLNGVYFHSSSHAPLMNLKITNTGDQGIYTTSGSDVQLTDVTIKNAGKIGISSDSSSTAMTYNNVVIDGAGGDGINLFNGSRVNFTNFSILNAQGNAFKVYNGANLIGDILKMNNIGGYIAVAYGGVTVTATHVTLGTYNNFFDISSGATVTLTN